MKIVEDQVFEVDFKSDGTVWVHSQKLTFVKRNNVWQVGVPSVFELRDQYFFLNNNVVAHKLIRQALTAMGQEIPDKVELCDPPFGYPISEPAFPFDVPEDGPEQMIAEDFLRSQQQALHVPLLNQMNAIDTSAFQVARDPASGQVVFTYSRSRSKVFVNSPSFKGFSYYALEGKIPQSRGMKQPKQK